MTTAAAKRKLATVEEVQASKKPKRTRGQQLSRDMLPAEDNVGAAADEMKVVCPMPRASDRKTVLMRKFVHEKCISNNDVGVHTVKWAPEIELSNRDNEADKKMLQANFKLYMTNEHVTKSFEYDDVYSYGEYPVKAIYSVRKGLKTSNNDTVLDMDHATFSLLVSHGRKLCNFVDKNLRGKLFNSVEEMELPDVLSLDSREASNGNKVHTLLILSIFKWGKRVGKFQPFFNIRRFIENAEGRLAPTHKGLTLNYREMHNLVFSAAEYLNVMADQLAKPKLVHDKMKVVLGEKIKAFMKNNPDANTEKLEFLLDSDDLQDNESDDEEDTAADMQIFSDLKEISDSDNEMNETHSSFDDVSDADFI